MDIRIIFQTSFMDTVQATRLSIILDKAIYALVNEPYSCIHDLDLDVDE
jgi:hypothetical protein